MHQGPDQGNNTNDVTVERETSRCDVPWCDVAALFRMTEPLVSDNSCSTLLIPTLNNFKIWMASQYYQKVRLIFSRSDIITVGREKPHTKRSEAAKANKRRTNAPQDKQPWPCDSLSIALPRQPTPQSTQPSLFCINLSLEKE